MTVFDFKDELSTFTVYELNEILDATRYEIARRDKERREELKRNFFKAWKALTDDGSMIFLSRELREPLYIEDVEIE